MQFIVSLALATSLLALPAFAQTNAFLPTAGDAVVTNAQGRSFKGELRGYFNGQVVLASREGDVGEVTRRFNRADVRAIQFPGIELAATAADHVANGLWQEARDVLEILARQRGPYLEVLSSADLGMFFALIDARMRTRAEIDGIALAKRLATLPAASDRKAELEDAILIGHWQLGLIDEARELAREWCGRTQPGGTSALGWRILAELALREGKIEEALWISLQPIAYASFENPPHLNACFAIAITAAGRLENETVAARLRSEMAARTLDWPESLANPKEPASPHSSRISTTGPSKQPDLRLRLDQVLKLIVNPALP